MTAINAHLARLLWHVTGSKGKAWLEVQAYQGYIEAVLTRVNTVNGRRYSDDPTVFSWELANEPSGTVDITGQAVPCCAALCCVVLCRVVPCCACAVMCHVVLCRAVLCYAMLCRAVLSPLSPAMLSDLWHVQTPVPGLLLLYMKHWCSAHGCMSRPVE